MMTEAPRAIPLSELPAAEARGILERGLPEGMRQLLDFALALVRQGWGRRHPAHRQWFTTTGLVRCCPAGTRSLGTGITSDDGPCCPEEKYCSTSPTGSVS